MSGHARGLAGCFLIARRSLRLHFLSSCVTILSAALASGLVMAVFVISAQSRAAFEGGAAGFDAVLGGRGSQLQLVLNSIYHLETSPGNIPWELYEDIRDDPRVEFALPYALGDNYRGYRIIGTTDELFSGFEYGAGRKLALRAGGRPFDSERREAVVGAIAAARAGLELGATFKPRHGVASADGHVHEQEYVVVGILEPTSTPVDRVIWIPIEGVHRMGGHILRGAGADFVAKPGFPIPEEHLVVSCVLLRLKHRQAGHMLNEEINLDDDRATFAWPITKHVADLFDKLGVVSRLLELVAYLVVVVAAGSILASLYNTMNERRREFAILRSLGARRRSVFTVILIEAGALAFLGALLGYVVYYGLLSVGAAIVRERTGVVLDLGALHPVLWLTPLGMLAIGAVAGLLPAWRAYRTDVAETLAGA